MSHDKFEVECYDLSTKKLTRTVKPATEDTADPYTSPGICITVAPEGSAFASDCRGMHIFDAVSGNIIDSLPANTWNTPIGFIPGGQRYILEPGRADDGSIAGGLSKGDLLVYDWKAKKMLAVLTGNTKDEIYGAASADGTRFVSMTRDGEGLVFDVTLQP